METAAQDFVDRCTAAAAELALFFVGAPTDRMTRALERVRSNLEAELAGTFGKEEAAEFARRFVAAVVGRRHEIEAEITVKVAPCGTTPTSRC